MAMDRLTAGTGRTRTAGFWGVGGAGSGDGVRFGGMTRDEGQICMIVQGCWGKPLEPRAGPGAGRPALMRGAPQAAFS